jgi:polyhydroxyalkanoate synthase
MKNNVLSQLGDSGTLPRFHFPSVFEQLDQSRRWLGELFDLAGLAPLETPYQVAFTEPGVTLRVYGNNQTAGPVLLLVPAPIKQAYIWDLSPGASVVQQGLRHGVRVYLIQWAQPGQHEQNFGLAEYADRLILDCLEVIQAETGQPQLFLAGHSLGGTLAAIFSTLYPARVQGLILVGAPIHFGPEVGVFGPLVTMSPRVQLLTTVLGNVPGSVLSMLSFMAAPATFGWVRWLDWLNSLPDSEAMQTYLRVERWTCDEMPLARRLVEEVVELLGCEDRFMQGRLLVGGKWAAPERVQAPVLSLVDARCRLVPPEAVLPFHQAVQSAETRVLWYQGDSGVSLQHVGLLVGRQAHQQLWPEVMRWIHAHWKAEREFRLLKMIE